MLWRGLDEFGRTGALATRMLRAARDLRSCAGHLRGDQ